MKSDFATFVGAWALLLTCIVLIVEPLAPGNRWFNRALRLATGIAGLTTFLFAHGWWQRIQGASPVAAELHDWTSVVSLTEVFLMAWAWIAAVALPAMAPARFYRRMRPALIGGQLAVTVLSLVGLSVVALNNPRDSDGPIEIIAAVLAMSLLLGSVTVAIRWFAQGQLDQAKSRFLACRRAKTTALWLKHRLLLDDPTAPETGG